MTVTAHLITVRGTHSDVELTEHRMVDDLNTAIGARIFDMISLDHGIDAVVDDEGAIVANPQLNLVLTIIMHAFGEGRAIFGDGLLVGSTPDGDTVSLNDEQRALINHIFDHGVDETITTAVSKTLHSVPLAAQLVRAAFV